MENFFFDLTKIEELLNVVFQDKAILCQAFVHSSFCNENKGVVSNERLEFLGDSLLNFLIASFLFRQVPHLDEGHLTDLRAQLVSATACSSYLRHLKLETYLLLGKGERMGGVKESMISDLFEAILGAIYLDQGFDKASTFFFENFEKNMLDKIQIPDKNWKATFQDFVQKKYHVTPEYRMIQESGPSHKKLFLVAVYVGEEKFAEGFGESKKKAEMDAAKNAMQNN